MQHLEVRWPCSLSPAATDLLLQSKQIFNLKPNDDFSLGKGSEHGLAHVLEGLVIGGMTASRRPSPFVLFDAGSWFGGSQIYEKSAFRYPKESPIFCGSWQSDFPRCAVRSP